MRINLMIDRKTNCNAERNHREGNSRTVANATRGGFKRRRGRDFCRAALAVGTAGLLSLCAVASPLAPGIRVYATQWTPIPNNPPNGNLPKVENGQKMINNGDGSLWAKVDDNYGWIVNNNTKAEIINTYNKVSNNYGKISGNYNLVENNLSGASLLYNMDNGRVEKNEGHIEQNRGYVKNESNGSVYSNVRDISSGAIGIVENIGGRVDKNNSLVKNEGGIVDWNDFDGVVDNYYGGTVKNNLYGSINNYTGGTVDENHNGVVNNHGGTVTKNLTGGTVYNFSGHIEINDGTAHNYGGTIGKGGTGTVIAYFSVEIKSAHATAYYDNNSFDYDKVQDKNWLKQGGSGEIRITPAAGYQIDSIDVGSTGATAVQNADGSWTITVENIQGNIKESDWNVLTSAVINVKPEEQQRWSFPVIFTFGGGESSSSSPAPVPAARPVAETKENFDSVYYADNNPDVYAAYGYDHDLLWEHYVTYGKQENRKARFIEGIHKDSDRSGGKGDSNESGTKEDFDAIAYADYYADVKAQYGYDEEALWLHYDSFGRAEGRLYFAKR